MTLFVFLCIWICTCTSVKNRSSISRHIHVHWAMNVEHTLIVPLTFRHNVAFLIQESRGGYNDHVVHKTFDELRSFTWIWERANTKWNDNCIICSSGSYYNNSDGDLDESGGSDEYGPSAATSAQERASSCKSQGMRASPPRLALWTLHSQANTTSRHQHDPVGVTLNLCLNLLTAGHSWCWPAREGQGTGSVGLGAPGQRWLRDEWVERTLK